MGRVEPSAGTSRAGQEYGTRFHEGASGSLARTMYKTFFGLRANPFSVSPDPRYLFLTRHMQEALDCLTYGIQSRKGFVLLTGEVGTGKTTLINKLLELLHE